MTPTEAYRIGYREVLGGEPANPSRFLQMAISAFTIMQLELAYENGRFDAVEAQYEKEHAQ